MSEVVFSFSWKSESQGRRTKASLMAASLQRRETRNALVFEVRGVQLTGRTAPELCPLDGCPHKSYFWIQTTAENNQLAAKWPVLTPKKIKRDDKLRELLNTPVDVKRRKTATPLEKHPVEMSNRFLPTCGMLSEMYKTEKKRMTNLEEVNETFSVVPHRVLASDLMFNVDEPFPYASAVYKKLYGQCVENVKEISKNYIQQRTLKKDKSRIEKRTIRIKGVEPQPSLDNY